MNPQRFNINSNLRAVSIFVFCFSVLHGSLAFAEDSIKSQPSQMTVAGFRCILPIACNEPKLERTLVLESTEQNRASQTPIQSFRVLATDFERKDSQAIIPAEEVSSTLKPTAKLLPQKFLSVPVTLHLDGILQSGEYTGTVIIEHSRGDLSVPVTIKIKDSWYLALPVLIFGVVLAFGLSVYQAEGFDRDEIMLKTGQLRLRIQAEIHKLSDGQEVAKLFQAKVESQLVDVTTQLDNKNWAAAQKEFDEAQTVWVGWSKERNDWIAMNEYLRQSLESSLEVEIPTDSAYGKDLRFQLDQLKRRIADYETPQKFREALRPIKDKIQT